MSMLNPPNPLVTIPLQSLVRDLLGAAHYTSISKVVADMLYIHTKNKHTCHIQFPSDSDVDMWDKPITSPILWDMSAWLSSSEKHLKAKRDSQARRDARFILDANILLLARAICRFTNIDFEICKLIARKWITTNDPRIQVVGLKRPLYTTVQELPS